MTAAPALPGVFAALAPVLDTYGYLAVGGLLFLEDFGVPAPGETVLVAAAVYAGAGRLNLVLVALIAVIAAIAGDNVGFALGRYGGRRLVVRFGRYVGLAPSRLDAAERFFDRHGGKVIVVARFVEGLRQANGILAGISGMPWLRFLMFNVLGALLWVGTWTTLGDLAGAHLGTIYGALRRYELVLLAALAVLVVVAVLRRRRRGRRDDQSHPGARDEAVEAPSPSPVGPPPRATGAAMIVAGAVLAVLWAGVATGTLLAALDPTVTGRLVAVRPAALVTAARLASEAAQPTVMIVLLVAVAAVVAARARSWAPVMIAAGALVALGLADNGVKAVVARPRPPLAWHAMPAHGLSFPSGHALWSVGALLLVVVLVGPCRGRRVLVAVAVLLAVLVAGSRVVLGVHYPSDVLAGWCLAVLADGVVLLSVVRVRSGRRPRIRRVPVPPHDGHAHEHGQEHGQEHGHEHGHGDAQGLWRRLGHQVGHLLRPHSHDSHEKVDSALESSRAGLRALWVSLAILGATALAQAVVVLLSGSVALLGDTLHNIADALTAVPLGVAFLLARRAPTRRYTYGYGRAEDLAGILIVVTIAASAVLAGYEAVVRLLHPQPVSYLGAVAGAAVVGFIGNEVVARYRITVGRRIGSAALVADGLHARIDGFTSLAVLLGAGGAALGWWWADPAVGLAITAAIVMVLRDAAREVYRRLMDAVDPTLVDRAEATLAAIPGVHDVAAVRMRWIGHRLHAEADLVVDDDLTVRAAHEIAADAEHQLAHEIPQLAGATVHTDPASHPGAEHHIDLSHRRRRRPEPTSR